MTSVDSTGRLLGGDGGEGVNKLNTPPRYGDLSPGDHGRFLRRCSACSSGELGA
jgi:hypothetical protein